MNEVEIPIKLGGVQSLKAQLRSLKAELASATDPAQMEALAKQAGELSDRIKDANDAVNVFASGSKFEQISNSFSGIGDSLMSLDFEEANEKSKVFAKQLGNLNAKDISKSLTGLAGTIKNVGGAFLKLGAQILINPIFFIAAIIAAVVASIVGLLKYFGVLDKVISTLVAPINLLIAKFKELTDWLGLTSYAAEENAERTSKANEKVTESSKKRAERISDAYDIEIAKAKASGKDTTDLEVAKSKRISEEAKIRLSAAQEDYRAQLKIASADNFEKRKKLKEQIDAEKKILSDGKKERKLLLIEDAKEQEDKEKEDAKKRAENAKAYAKNRLDASRTIKDIEISLIKDDNEREIATINEKYKRLAEDAKKNENLTGAEKIRIMKLYEEQRLSELAKANDKILAADKAQAEKLKKQNDDYNNAELDRKEAIQEQIYQTSLTDKEKELQENQYKYDELIAEANRYGLDTSVLVEKQKKEEAEINKKYADQEKQLALEKISNEKAVRDAKIDIASSIADGLGAIGGAFIKDQKKLEKFNKAQALVQIGIDTAKAISSLVAMSQANPLNAVTAGTAGIAQYAAGIVQIVTNITKAKQLLSNPTSAGASGNGGGGASGGGNGGASSSTAIPSFVPGNLFGQGNNANNLKSSQAMDSSQTMILKAVVSETEITGVQNKINKIIKNSVL